MKIRDWVITGAAGLSLAGFQSPAQAQFPPADPATLQSLQRQVEALEAQIQALKQAQKEADPSGALADLKRSSSNQYADLKNQLAALPKTSVDNARLQVTSADGHFSVALRTLVQFDVGYFA